MLASSMAMFAINVDFFAVQATLPPMARDLDTTVTALQWVISGYMLALASFLIVGGRLADLLGRRRFLILGAVIFGLSSLAAGAASTGEMVIVMRVVQGLGAAILFPVCLAVVTNAFPTNKTQRAVGLVFGISAVGQALGPIVGGGIAELLSWRWVLWVNVPVSVAIIVLTLTSVEESRDETVPPVIDWTGLVLVVASIGAFTYGVDRAGDWGWGAAPTLGLMALGLAGLGAFVFVESRVRHPLLDLELFRIKMFDLVVVGGTAGNVAIVSTIFLSMIFLQDVEGLSAFEAGAVFLAFSAAVTGIDQLSGRLERFRPWAVMASALAVGGLGSIGMALSGSLPLFAFASVFAGAGLGLAWAYTSVVTQDVVPAKEAGQASGAVLTILIGTAGVGVALSSSVVNTGVDVPSDLGDAVRGVLVGVGAVAAVVAPVMVWLGRRIDVRDRHAVAAPGTGSAAAQ